MQVASQQKMPLRLAAKRLGVEKETLRSQIRKNQVAGIKQNNRWYVSFDEIHRIEEFKRENVPAAYYIQSKLNLAHNSVKYYLCGEKHTFRTLVYLNGTYWIGKAEADHFCKWYLDANRKRSSPYGGREGN